MEILQYDFMRRALLAGLLLAIIIPLVGTVVVFKRLSMIGDALSHTSLAGVAAGLLLGINPVLGAIAVSIIAALSIEVIRKKLPRYSELSIAIVTSAGIGLAGVLSGFVNNSANFNSFLFGSIVAISGFEQLLVIIVSAVVLISFLLLYKELFYIALDESSARLAGIPVKLVNFIFTLLTAITVSVAARTVGALVVSSLMVVPTACAMQLARSYRQTVALSVLFAVSFTISGLFLSYYADLRPGGTIVLIGVIVLILIIMAKALIGRFGGRNAAVAQQVRDLPLQEEGEL
ncbi:MAG: metal ABC transporter permease [Clostridiaceae bacterium]|nr:metal ABC transporter permease [Clostridiaceae bacterium]